MKLPGDDRVRRRPLRPVGAKFATADRNVAEAVARAMLEAAVFDARPMPAGWDGSLAGLVRMYEVHAADYYCGSSEPDRIHQSLRLVVQMHGAALAESFGPLAMKEVRAAMINNRRVGGKALARRTVNQRVGVIKRMFRWAASEQLIPASVYHALQSVDGLRRGRSAARETAPVGPIAEVWVHKTMRVMPPALAAMVEVQLLTGMRSGELVTMRPADVDTSGAIWVYRPRSHKTAHHGHARAVVIGPQAQKVLAPYLTTDLARSCFTPRLTTAQRDASRRSRRKSKVPPSQADRSRPETRVRERAGDQWTPATYRRAVSYAVRLARREIDPAIPDWTPHQLRHTAATKIRREIGLDAARAVLGQKSLAIADTYAEIDSALAIETARRLG